VAFGSERVVSLWNSLRVSVDFTSLHRLGVLVNSILLTRTSRSLYEKEEVNTFPSKR